MYSGGLYTSSHSSKPGVIYSKDDFYALSRPDQQLVVMETTNGVMNSELYSLVTPKSLLTWQRIPLTNSLPDVTSGEKWTETFSRHNSGTYCNQYMVLDMKLFRAGHGPSAKDFLWIVEVAPGITAAKDVTNVFLNNGGYWPSFNIPFQKDVYIVTGFQAAYEEYGDKYSYDNCSRSQMYTRDQGGIYTFEDMQKELRYNKYQTDPLSEGDPYNSISSRKDLREESASTSGGIDSKITSYTRMIAAVSAAKAGVSPTVGLVSAQSGPTHDDQTPFQWSTSQWANLQHAGQPDLFNFDFVDIDINKYN